MPTDFSTVIPFQRPDQAVADTFPQHDGTPRVSSHAWLRRAGLHSVHLTLVTLRSLLFVALLWLRGPLQLVCRCVSGASLLAFFLLWLGLPHTEPLKTEMLVTLSSVGLMATALMWGYDRMVMRLAPGLT